MITYKSKLINSSRPDHAHVNINGLVQERCNSIANALELQLSCTNPLINWCIIWLFVRNNEWQVIAWANTKSVPWCTYVSPGASIDCPGLENLGYLGRPCTQHNWITPHLVAHHGAAHNPAVWWCAGLLCAICPDSNVGWPNVGPTFIAVWLVRLWRRLPIWVGDAHNLASIPPSCRVVCSSLVCC